MAASSFNDGTKNPALLGLAGDELDDVLERIELEDDMVNISFLK